MKQTLLAFLMLLALLNLGGAVLAEEMQILSLPANLKQIEDEAFYADASLEKVVLPEGTVQIGSRAFADSSLKEIELPYSLETIAEDAFSGCEGLVAYAVDRSYAQEYCAKNNITCLPLALPASDFTYELNEDGASWAITSYRGTAKNVMIPGIIEGKPVTTLSQKLFYGRDNIHSVYIPNTVALIGYDAFGFSDSLQKVVLPKDLKTIPSFNKCFNLEEIVWPENYTSFSSFTNCRKLKSFRVPDGMTEIPPSAFCGCASLTEVEIPDSVTVIRGGAFEGCSALKTIEIPDSVTVIGSNAFEGCRALETIEIPESVTEIEEQAFMDCTRLKSIVLPLNCEYLGFEVFRGCPALTVQVVGNSGAEDYCRWHGINYVAVGETDIDYLFETTTLEDGGCEITKYNGRRYRLEIPAEIRGERVRSIGNEAFFDNDYLHSVTLPEGITTIGSKAFYECGYMDIESFPSTLRSIGFAAFEGNSYLKEAVIPESVTELGSGAFACCDSLKKVILPSGLREISDWLFYGCDGLKSIEIPAGVKRIGSYAFNCCDLLQFPVLPEGLEEIGAGAFEDCYSLEEITFPKSLTRIEKYAFYRCENLRLAVVPASVTEVGSNAFKGTPLLTMVTERGGAALEYCKDNGVFFIIEPTAESDFKIKEVSSTTCRIIGYTGTDVDVFLPETIGGLTVEAIYSNAFKYNTKIESISILNSVNTIGGKAFKGCTALRYAAISDRVTSIAQNAFDGCTNLKQMLTVILTGE